MHLSGLDDQHRAYVFSALEEMPPIGRFRTDEPREVKRVVGIRKNQKVFFRATHAVSVARARFMNYLAWVEPELPLNRLACRAEEFLGL